MKLLLLAPCERLIIERGANVVSMISLIEEMTPGLLPGAANTRLQPDAVLPTTWYVLSLWGREESEVGDLRLQVKVDVVNPRGEATLQLLSPMVDVKKERHRHIFTIRGFPIGLAGTLLVRVSARSSEDAEFGRTYDYPIVVKEPQSVAVG